VPNSTLKFVNKGISICFNCQVFILPTVDGFKSVLPFGICSGCEHLFEPINVFESQSGITNDQNVYKMSNDTKYQNVEFSDQHDPYMVDIDQTMDPTRKMQDTDDATLGNFFKRPIKIFEQEWGTGTLLNFEIDPWSLYWENPRVLSRISTFNLLRCNLHLKILINGNGFHYGRGLVAYLPYADRDSLSTNSALVQQDLVGTSQLPHVFLDPTTSSGGEMVLPFFFHKNYLNIPFKEWGEMGNLLMRSINQLKHANGASDQVTVSVFAWAEDVSMSVLTSLDPIPDPPPDDPFESQSGAEIDEANATGVVSGPATTVAKWSAYLAKVPYISPFFMATSIAANATAGIAKIFGFCRPPVTKNPEPYRPTPVSSLALTNTPDTAQRLTMDDKQELTLDPRISGIGGVDPLNIREIAKRESYLTTFNWDISTAPETLLWNARVDPTIWNESGLLGAKAFHFPACAMAALPFKYWTGSMKFRFQVVCSSFHKGRIKVVYDPNHLASNEYNTNYLKIVDIANEQDFTIEIGNGQNVTLLEHNNPGETPLTTMFSSTPYTFAARGNGVIGMYVVNELTVPNSITNNDIQVNVYVSMGDDFEVFVPENRFALFTNKPRSVFESQSGEIVPDAQNTSEPSAPQQSLSTNVGPGLQQSPDITKVFAGEAIVSLRSLLKRYSLWTCLASGTNKKSRIVGRFGIFPYLRGNAPPTVDIASGGENYNFCNSLLLHWVRNSYSGWRGSIRYKLIPRGYSNSQDHIEVERAVYKNTELSYYNEYYEEEPYADSNKARAACMYQIDPLLNLTDFKNFQYGGQGKALAYNSVNGALEFEVPYQCNLRFSPGKPVGYTGPQDLVPGGFDYRFVTQTVPDLEENENISMTYDIYTSAGEDFQTYFFTGLPRMYYEKEAPEPL
jgi:hypothetical protein